jgi:hypothetical protein
MGFKNEEGRNFERAGTEGSGKGRESHENLRWSRNICYKSTTTRKEVYCFA